jgi:hypothetical protein
MGSALTGVRLLLVTPEVRAHDPHAHMPCIICTAWAVHYDCEQAYSENTSTESEHLRPIVPNFHSELCTVVDDPRTAVAVVPFLTTSHSSACSIIFQQGRVPCHCPRPGPGASGRPGRWGTARPPRRAVKFKSHQVAFFDAHRM